MRTLLVLAGFLALAGCSNKKDRETAAVGAVPHTPTTTTSLQPTPAAGSGSAGSGSAATAEAPAANTGTIQPLGCDKIFPVALREKYFPKATVAAVEGAMGSGSCTVTLADKTTVNITAMCWDGVPAGAQDASFAKLKQLALTEPTIVDVGKGTRYTPTSPTRNMMVAWDDDAPCSISAELPTNVAVEAFAKDALATFPVH